MIEHIINVIAPHICVSCNIEGPILCRNCALLMSRPVSRCYHCKVITDDFKTCKACFSKYAIGSVRPVATYDGTAKALLHKLKFERAKAGAPAAARLMADNLPHGEPWLVTNVPTATSRARKRGYDQSQLIARELARLIGCKYAPLLIRVGQQRQVGQSRKARAAQIAHSFIAAKQKHIKGKRILLVDDVLTTGATLEAAAAVLAKAGCKSVDAAVFAVA